MKKIIKQAFIDTIPVLTGYLFIGLGFGIIAKTSGFSVLYAVLMSVFVYAGSMQYAAIGLLTGGASFFTCAITTFMVNARHIFYGISMLGRYKGTGAIKPYLIFALTDETYSLAVKDDVKDRKYYFFISLFDQCYWVLGTLLGGLVGSLIKFNSDGIDFALTALFITVFLDQWLNSKKHSSAIIGVLVSVCSLIIFGAEKFLIQTMLIITLLLILKKEDVTND